MKELNYVELAAASQALKGGNVSSQVYEYLASYLSQIPLPKEVELARQCFSKDRNDKLAARVLSEYIDKIVAVSVTVDSESFTIQEEQAEGKD